MLSASHPPSALQPTQSANAQNQPGVAVGEAVARGVTVRVCEPETVAVAVCELAMTPTHLPDGHSVHAPLPSTDQHPRNALDIAFVELDGRQSPSPSQCNAITLAPSGSYCSWYDESHV